MTVHSFLIDKRLIRACEVLREGGSVTESWQSTGFSDYTSFLRNFREKLGIPPRYYRENSSSLIGSFDVDSMDGQEK